MDAMGGAAPRLAAVRWMTVAPWLVAAVAIATAVVVVARTPAPATGTVASMIVPPPGQAFEEMESFGTLSPDGRRFVFTARNAKGETQLWVRRLDSLEARPLVGTAGARAPFFSPDGAHLAFFVDDNLFLADASGGAARTLCTVPDAIAGSWGRGDVIAIASGAGVLRVDVSRGACTLAIKHDPAWGGAARHPSMLSDGQHVIFSSSASCFSPSTASDRRPPLRTAQAPGLHSQASVRPLSRLQNAEAHDGRAVC